MKQNKKMMESIMWVIIGEVLISLGFMGKVDSFWNGMGSGLFVVGILQLLRTYRFNKNEAYREKMEIEAADERNHFIRNKAWAWSGYLFVLIMAISCIVLKIIGQEVLSIAASFTICLMLMLYWFSYMVLNKKY